MEANPSPTQGFEAFRRQEHATKRKQRRGGRGYDKNRIPTT